MFKFYHRSRTQIEIHYYHLENGNISPSSNKINILKNWKKDHPKRSKQLKNKKQSLLGLINSLGNFLPNLHKTLDPIYKSQSPKHWNTKCDQALDEIIKTLSESPSVSIPNESKPFNPFVDTSQQGTGAFLTQKDENNKFILLDCFSKRMLSKQPPTYMEMSGIKAATRKWQTFLHHSTFKIFTDHRPLTGKNIKEEKLLYEFAKINHLDFEIEYIQGNQHFLADFLSRSPTSLMAIKKKTEAQRLDQQEKTEIQKIKKAHLKKQKQLLKESEKQKKKEKKNIQEQKEQKKQKEEGKSKEQTFEKIQIDPSTKLRKIEKKYTKLKEHHIPLDLNISTLKTYQENDPISKEFQVLEDGIYGSEGKWYIPATIAETVITDIHTINGHHSIKKTLIQIKNRFIIDKSHRTNNRNR